MTGKLTGKKIAILATDGFEQVELTEPRRMLEEAGATADVIAPKPGEIRGWKFTDWGDMVKVNKTLDQVNVENYDALVLPGGVMNPDHLRMDPKAVAFVQKFVQSGKPVAAICHAPWMLVEAGVVKGMNVTSWPSVKTDLKNAGGNWTDQQAVVDQNIITSRKPEDIPVFSQKIIEMVVQHRREWKAAS